MESETEPAGRADALVLGAERPFRVQGVDEFGDLHVFASASPERAEAMLLQMREDLEQVAFVDSAAASASARPNLPAKARGSGGE